MCTNADRFASFSPLVPTFRGPGGLWRSHDPLSLATPAAFQSDPSQVWQFYHWRRQACLSAKPNAAHEAISWLSSKQGHEATFPAASSPSRRFRLVTQNVDGLSKRANDALSKSIDSGGAPLDPLEMHGSLFRTMCTSCGDQQWNFDSPICDSLRGTEDTSKPLARLPLKELPRCKSLRCNDAVDGGGLLRPGVVWFGESIPLLDTIAPLVERCDLLLVLGTSSTVYPAAGFAAQVRARGGKVAVFNLDGGEETGSGEADFFFQGPVEETLPTALGLASPSSAARA